ncbi:hypothetical protein QBC34DRAFT_208126 [Podospora aff. communis PSN243]|uniref:Uncharacterized protein n=1 Tax=Podospora aff. communis PSN243 TaxID=3040156 RepID=A0AAV9H090_9PEZI|nr:hypothetical protein QBC34DRAFT_208126 [Podospora aff. communis PSN243]
MSSDTASPLFSDRPIRPLPKRRLRERLSPEVADSIQYPPAPRVVAPLFQYPYPLRDEEPEPTSTSRDRKFEAGLRSGRNGTGVDDVDIQESRSGVAGRGGSGHGGRSARTPPAAEHGRHTNSQLALSAASSVDGYDLLENTNNKKKRKIPTAGDAALNSMHTISDTATGGGAPLSGASSSADSRNEALSSTSTPYYGSGSFASGSPNVPGPGRGRYGRLRSSRSPLRPLSDSTNSWAGRNGKMRPGQWTSSAAENTGIISTAIANAEKLPQHGQENMSLLHQPVSTKHSPAFTQFTFTCDSQVPGSLAWPGSDRRTTTPGVQQPPSRAGNEGWQRGNHAVSNGQNSPSETQVHESGHREGVAKNGAVAQNQAGTTQKTLRRSAAKEYAAAAKARRRETLLYNRRHPPKPEEIWICDFCEYEAIFGRPPEALVRQYEIADRKQRQLEQQRRAQWERMKKGKHKGKKHSKPPAKSSNQAQDPHQADGTHGGPINSNCSQGTQSEEGYCEEEEYDDEDYGPDDEIPSLESRLGDVVQQNITGSYPMGDSFGTLRVVPKG